MKCDRCDLPMDTQYGCTCPPTRIVDDSKDYVEFESKFTWFLIGCLVTLGICGWVFP